MFVRVLLVFILLVVMPQIPMLEPWLWRVESVYNQNHNLFKFIKKRARYEHAMNTGTMGYLSTVKVRF